MKSIFVIDDSLPTRNLVTKILGSVGYQVNTASDGNDATMKLYDRANYFHLIITDLNMPNTDGIQFIKMARNNVRHKGTPILVMTTDFRKDQKDNCMQAGASDFILQPFTPNDLLNKVQSCF